VAPTVCIAWLAGCQSTSREPAWQTLNHVYQGKEVVFVAMETPRSDLIVHDLRRAAERFTPCSTFKIWNTLIGLETGVITGRDFELRWDPQQAPPQEHWPNSWKRDHDLTSAFGSSVYWFYQEIGRRIGSERMQQYLNVLHYGNRDIAGGIDRFWLESSLGISPIEQAQLIGRLVLGDVPFHKDHVKLVTELMRQDDARGFRLYAKTGLGHRPDGGYEGWFVGWVEVGSRKSPFALYMRADAYQDIDDERKAHALEGLRAIRLIP